MAMDDIDGYLQEHGSRFEEELKDLLRIASVSTDPAHHDDVRRAAGFVEGQLRGCGFETEVAETEGHPVVLGQWCGAAGAPTVLVYGHYDVQPPDPLEEWLTPPFEPTERDGNLYARGATDDKGQMYTHVKSAEAWMKTGGKLPVNLKFLIEGEEEIGSPHLESFVRQHAGQLECDCVVVSDTSQFAPGVPAITYGLRGLAYFEVIVGGPKQDLHSGGFGGSVANPAVALAKMLAGLHDEQRRVQIPGFYDDVVDLTPQERAAWAALPFDEEAYKQQLGVSELAGEEGYTTLERKWGRPTCDINGIFGGYMGEGSKTIVPARAGAKVSCRLVPQQDPKKVAAAFRAMMRDTCPPGLRVEVREYASCPAAVVPTQSGNVQAAQRAIELGFGTLPALMRHGGTIPVVGTFQEVLGADTLLLGWGLPDDNAHSPNEKFCIADFHRGIKTSAHLWKELAAHQL